LLDETSPHVVHIQHLVGLSADLIETARQRLVPTVATLHDLWFQCPSKHLRPQDRHPSGRWWGAGCIWHHVLRGAPRIAADAVRSRRVPALTGTLRRPAVLRRQLAAADALVAPSRYIVDEFSRFGVAPEKIRLLPHGITLEAASGAREPARPVRFGFVGSLVPTKGVHVLCDAFGRLSSESTLLLYGPAYGRRYMRRIRQYLGPRIRYEGEFTPADSARVYASFDVLVQPSLVGESFGLAAAEAHARGIPVIASSFGALPERVAHDRDGLLVPPGDRAALGHALVRLSDPTTVRRLANGIRPPRTMSSYVTDLEDLYGDLARRSPVGDAGRVDLSPGGVPRG
jgi:glycosyltransferase involved in cell wall biosynthesis